MDKQKTISCLDNIVLQYQYPELADKKIVKSNIEEGVIELSDLYFGDHRSNGLLITKDGYFITSKHCVCDIFKGNNKISGEVLRIQNKKTYPIEKVCIIGKEWDLAIAKAKIDAEPETIFYDLFNMNHIKNGIPVALITLWNLDIKKSFGYIRCTNYTGLVEDEDGSKKAFKDNLLSDICAKPGDSGGILVTHDQKLLGFMSSIPKYDKLNIGCIARIDKAIELIKAYSDYLKKN